MSVSSDSFLVATVPFDNVPDPFVCLLVNVVVFEEASSFCGELFCSTSIMLLSLDLRTVCWLNGTFGSRFMNLAFLLMFACSLVLESPK